MARALLLIDEHFAINECYRVVIKVYQVPANKKFPQGVKAKYVLIDTNLGTPRLLLDNHEPFGFHMHTALPEDCNLRVILDVTDYNKALSLFFKKVEAIIQNEK